MATAIASCASPLKIVNGLRLDLASSLANYQHQRIHWSSISRHRDRPLHLENPQTRRRRSLGCCRAYLAPEHGLDIYELLGVESTASQQEIRRSYRWLQKKCHPDIAGPIGHDMSILLNEAYVTLADPDRRAAYDQLRADWTEFDGYDGKPHYSKWFGPAKEDRAVFVDETRCIGCLKCALIASKTFAIETQFGRARAVGQWADPEPIIKDAITACPVDCISWVDRGKLAALEYILSKQPRLAVGIDVHSNGGVIAVNIFKATDKFLERQKQRENKKKSSLKETPAQREARLAAMEAVQARAGRWWHHFVGKKMKEDEKFSEMWDSDAARASQGAIVPLSFFETVTQGNESINDSSLEPSIDGRHFQGGKSWPGELKRLWEAAARRRRGSTESGIGEEYWVPIDPITCHVSFTRGKDSSKLRQESRIRKESHSWSWSGSLSMEKGVNSWVKGPSSGIALATSAVAAMLVGFTSETDAALYRAELMGPLPIEWTNSVVMQVLLAAAVWYTIGAVLCGAIMLIANLITTANQENHLHKH